MAMLRVGRSSMSRQAALISEEDLVFRASPSLAGTEKPTLLSHICR